MTYAGGYGLGADLGNAPWCLPTWRKRFEALEGSGRVSKPGCAIRGAEDTQWQGFVLCSPETLRAHAEAWMQSRGLWQGYLPLDVYSLSRNIASEIGSGTLEMKMALALSTMGHAVKKGIPVSTVILSNITQQPLYGAINKIVAEFDPELGTTKNKITAPYGRWTASSRDPQEVDILIAAAALRGDAGLPRDVSNFAAGADDQADSSIVNPITAGAQRRYWVGPLPNVNPKQLMLMRTYADIDPASPLGQQMIQRALAMKADPAPQWRVNAMCQGGGLLPDFEPSTTTKIAVAAALFAGTILVFGGIAMVWSARTPYRRRPREVAQLRPRAA